MSRRVAFKELSLEQYTAEMKGIFTTSVHKGTLDESPMAYKKIDEIIAHIGPTAEIVERMKPVYNFKAGD
jgi:RNA-splicing ligase RtcB